MANESQEVNGLRDRVVQCVAGLNLAAQTMGEAGAMLLVLAALKPLTKVQRRRVLNSIMGHEFLRGAF